MNTYSIGHQQVYNINSTVYVTTERKDDEKEDVVDSTDQGKYKQAIQSILDHKDWNVKSGIYDSFTAEMGAENGYATRGRAIAFFDKNGNFKGFDSAKTEVGDIRTKIRWFAKEVRTHIEDLRDKPVGSYDLSFKIGPKIFVKRPGKLWGSNWEKYESKEIKLEFSQESSALEKQTQIEVHNLQISLLKKSFDLYMQGLNERLRKLFKNTLAANLQAMKVPSAPDAFKLNEKGEITPITFESDARGALTFRSVGQIPSVNDQPMLPNTFDVVQFRMDEDEFGRPHLGYEVNSNLVPGGKQWKAHSKFKISSLKLEMMTRMFEILTKIKNQEVAKSKPKS